MTGLSGRSGLVTGAGSGIGQATARQLARRGVSVAVLDLDEESAQKTAVSIREEGGTALALRVDVADEDSVRDAIASTVGAFGGLHLAVNNAGVQAHNQDLTQIDVTTWERVLRINLTGVFVAMKHEIPEMVRAGGGAIVNMASNGGLYSIPHAPAYVASKHGVVGLTKTAAVDYAADGIRVNAVAPSLTHTPGLSRVAGDTDMLARQESITPLGRLAAPEEIAAAAVWLCSEESSYVTGVALSVDGGRRA
ncbi:SDR family NAD(P)-dependent oxidoreductase [Amycolatopsis pithecellobii]|uniref:Glucose 1-dehydrogenase n=1 Tax=Amycolatopsis pithecellobii TaxID=664692 RepID=A0A6N7YX25_9PSEU|nr:glucose 1-dehydrogenase [Amycolatopsis pithecellobii]MTD56482.1 glucose 1-dehydrogenase [Amycolatopsis pithecellobii]